MTTTSDCVLNIDVGTSSLKAALFDIKGNMLARAVVNYQYSMPHPNRAEQNPQAWWEACCRACGKILNEVKQPILAICVSGQAPGCVPVKRDGSPVRPAILWLDRRSTVQAEWLNQHLDLKQTPQIGLNTMDSFFGGVKWLWYRQNEPENYESTWKILQANGFIVLKLTGETATDPSHAGICSPCFDVQTRCWSESICQQIGIDSEKLPAIFPSSEIVGTVTKFAARETGLPTGTPVVCGAPDFVCAHLGSGAIGQGTASMMLGTAGNLMALSPGSTNTRMLNTVYVTDEIISTGGVLAGAAVSWFGEMLNINMPNLYETLDREAAGVEPGAGNLVFLPHLIGGRSPIWDADARGVYLGLSTSHQRSHLYRAVLEGVAYGFRQLMEIFAENGTDLHEIAVVNGGARSALWRQILADVLGVPLLWRPTKDSTSLGGACLASLALKILSDPMEIKAWLEPTVDTLPNPENSQKYRHFYTIYLTLYEKLKDLFPALHRPMS